MRYRRELKTGLIRTYEHVKADEEKMLTDAYMNTKLSKLCREEKLRKVKWFVFFLLVGNFSKDNLLLMQCYYRKKPKLN